MQTLNSGSLVCREVMWHFPSLLKAKQDQMELWGTDHNQLSY